MTEPLGGTWSMFAARAVVRARYLVVLLWIGGAVAATVLLPSLSESGGAPLSGLIAADSESIEARTRSAELFELPVLSEIAIVQRNASGLPPEAQERVVTRAAQLSAGAGEDDVAFALPILNSRGIFPGSREEGTTAVTFLFYELGMDVGDRLASAHAVADEIAQRPQDGLAGVTGPAAGRAEEASTIQDALPLVEGVTVALIALVVGLTFRSLVAPFVALVCAGLAYLVAVRVLPLVGAQMGVGMPEEIEPLVVVLLLGIVTDYAIFFLSAHRAQLAAGETGRRAARRATARTLPIVFTAGLIVAAGAAALIAGRLDYFRALGPGLALTAIVGLLAGITLIPALLAILGRAALWPRRIAVGPPAPIAADPTRRRLRERIAYVVTARPSAAATVVLVGGALLFATFQLRGADLGFTLVSGLPGDAEPRTASEAAEAGFAPGVLAPTELIFQADGIGERRTELVRLQELVAAQEGVAGVLGPREVPADVPPGVVVSEEGDAARMVVVLEDDPLGGEAIDRLDALDENLPGLAAEAGLPDVEVLVGGNTALARDTVDQTLGDLLRIAAAALAVNLLFLVLFLRALVAPLLLLASSVLALGATLGITAVVFQDALGYEELTYYVPFAAAVLLVSLGSDYNVFVVGRVWEEARRRPVRDAIAIAAPRASGAITVAGLALAASFAVLALVPLRAFRELAFALALGVLIDAFVVRSLLVPSLVALFGRWSWWPGRPPQPDAAPGGPAPAAGAPLADAGAALAQSARTGAH